MKYQVKYFTLREFECPDCRVVRISSTLVFWLDQIRKAVGAPLVISSGYRCEERNIYVKGSAVSRHMIGCAADILSPGTMGYDVFTHIVRRFAYAGCEVVTYDNKRYLPFAVPRLELGCVWDGGLLSI